MSYDRVVFRAGKKLLFSELNELQEIEISKLEDAMFLLTGQRSGVKSRTLTPGNNSITVVATLFGFGRLFNVPSTTVNNLYGSGVTVNTDGILYAEISETIITGDTDYGILHPTLLIKTSDRIRYALTLKFTTGTLPNDVTGGNPGTNKRFIPIAILTGRFGTVPTVDPHAYPAIVTPDTASQTRVTIGKTAPQYPTSKDLWINTN